MNSIKTDRHGKASGTIVLAVSALLVALTVVLQALIIFRLPQGGGITPFSMLPIAVCAYMFGTKRAFLAGACVGFIVLIINPFIIHPVQLLLDYPLAFGALGLGGFAARGRFGIIWAYLIGIFGRYICAVLSGIIFFGSYAPEGFNTVAWSLFYNATYIGVEGAMTVVLLLLPQVRNLFARLKGQIEQ